MLLTKNFVATHLKYITVKLVAIKASNFSQEEYTVLRTALSVVDKFDDTLPQERHFLDSHQLDKLREPILSSLTSRTEIWREDVAKALGNEYE